MTKQIQDRLIVNGEQFPLIENPDIPSEHPGIARIFSQDPRFIHSYANSTACIRGYYATWTIGHDYLWLVNLVGRMELAGELAICAEWFTGTLRAQLKIDYFTKEDLAFLVAEELDIVVMEGIVKNYATNRKVENNGRAFSREELLARYPSDIERSS